MSEYQFYDFAAVDCPLTKKQMSQLRALSTRARITPRRFTNTYHWGDFKGSPDEMMEDYFDAHLYTSNFGYRKLYLRVPASVLSLASIENYLFEDCLEAWESHGNLILKFTLNNEDGGSDWDDDYDWEGDHRESRYDDDYYRDDDYDDEDDDNWNDSPRSLDALLSLRDELANGDLRAL